MRRLPVDGDHVAGAIDGGVPARRAELFEEPRGALPFQKSERRHAAKLQMGFVDPLLFAREPLETLAHPPMLYDFTEIEPHGGAMGSPSPRGDRKNVVEG